MESKWKIISRTEKMNVLGKKMMRRNKGNHERVPRHGWKKLIELFS